jgi:DNA-binding IclR family transcriptional regulator
MREEDEPLGDTQEMTGEELRVYEAVAALSVDQRPATTGEIAAMTDLPEETVRRCLDTLADEGRVIPKGDSYQLGPHDWGLDY